MNANKLKICFTSPQAYYYFNPKPGIRLGGAELQLYYLAKELSKDERFEINFLVGDFGQPAFEIKNNVNLYKFRKSGIGIIKFIGILTSLWKLLKKVDADLYMQRAAGIETGIIALFCKIKNKKFIYMTANDEDVGTTIPSYCSRSLNGRIRWQLFKFGLRKADFIFTQNTKQQEILKKNYDKKSIVRKSAHIINPFLEQNDGAKKNGVLWVGKADKITKQPEIFIKLVNEFPSENFTMVCPVSNDKKYFQIIKKLANGQKNIKFIDYVPFDRIDEYFMGAAVFVNTSSTEGFPNTFIQAAKNKTPILSLTINPDNLLSSQIDQSNADKPIGLCADGDFSKMTGQLKILLENKNIRQKLSENSYQYAKKNHDLRKIAEEDKKIILDLLKLNF